MLGKLRTRDKLQFISTDPLCPLCQNSSESYAHLFFSCAWSSSLSGKARYWLKLHISMPTLNRAVRVLSNNEKGLQPRMRRVSLAFLVYLIWEERNRRIFTNTAKSVEVIFRKFQILFYTILYFHKKNPLAYNVASWIAPFIFLFRLGRAWFLQGFYVFAWMRWHVTTVCGWWADGLQLLAGSFCLYIDELQGCCYFGWWVVSILGWVASVSTWMRWRFLRPCMDESKVAAVFGW